METRLDRRQFACIPAGFAAAFAVSPRILAQQATPSLTEAVPTDDGIDVPVLNLNFSSEGVTATAEVPAGMVRMLTSSDGSDDQGTLLFQVPDSEDVDAILTLARDSEAVPPDWFFDTNFPGGVRNDSHTPSVAEGFLMLDPGIYIVTDEFTGTDAAIVVTGEPGEPVDLPASITVSAEDTMTFTGLENPIPAGRQLWQFDNGGNLHHEISIFGTPEGATADDIHGIFEMLFSGATPEDGGDPFAGYGEGLMSTFMLSGGLTNWFYLDLTPGPYAAMCAAFDSIEEPPHFMMGMIVTFTVV